MQHLVHNVSYSVVPINSSHNNFLLGWNSIRIWRHKIFGPFHNVLKNFVCKCVYSTDVGNKSNEQRMARKG
jgi:hypothetical protein